MSNSLFRYIRSSITYPEMPQCASAATVDPLSGDLRWPPTVARVEILRASDADAHGTWRCSAGDMPRWRCHWEIWPAPRRTCDEGDVEEEGKTNTWNYKLQMGERGKHFASFICSLHFICPRTHTHKHRVKLTWQPIGRRWVWAWLL